MYWCYLYIYTHLFKVGEWADLSSEDTFAKIIHWIALCDTFNATEQPAVTLSLGLDSNGLPLFEHKVS
ncbi:Amidase [Richelia intracellularis HH01]|jgi:amidase|uniref:Amidase n=1 Tax=Richelia intracellularis HH01 TaxID=1165094 RepID=M1X311_9NOST|nr:Amidase [Richelia intracellularis HH01]